MPRFGILFAFVAMLACIGSVQAESDLSARLNGETMGNVQIGAFTAGDHVRFTLVRYSDKYLMRFDGDPEIYVLYPDHGSLGGRVLKYDSGGTAVQVSGWGAMTVYTDAQPGGLPAERVDNGQEPSLPAVSPSAIQAAADDEGDHLAYVRGLHLAFGIDWAALGADAGLRSLAFDALQNAARGIDRFTANPAARQVIAAKLDSVRLEPGHRPMITLHGKTLLVTFVPQQGFAGRASSHGIARALGQLFTVPTPG